MDRIVPRNLGGSDDLSNLQALCFHCNAASDGRREAGCGLCTLNASGWEPIKSTAA
jgi:ATP adenylyltransferase